MHTVENSLSFGVSCPSFRKILENVWEERSLFFFCLWFSLHLAELEKQGKMIRVTNQSVPTVHEVLRPFLAVVLFRCLAKRFLMDILLDAFSPDNPYLLLGSRKRGSNLDPHPQPQTSWVGIFLSGTRPRMEVLTDWRTWSDKNVSRCSLQDFSHSLTEENQVSLLRIVPSEPDSDGNSPDLGVGGGKTVLRKGGFTVWKGGGFATAFLCPLSLIQHHVKVPRKKKFGGHLERTMALDKGARSHRYTVPNPLRHQRFQKAYPQRAQWKNK